MPNSSNIINLGKCVMQQPLKALFLESGIHQYFLEIGLSLKKMESSMAIAI